MDINEATAAQLQSAFEVDGTRARYLTEHRKRSGPFRSWDEVKQVPGFDDRVVENLKCAGLTIEQQHQPERLSGPRNKSEAVQEAKDRSGSEGSESTERAGTRKRGLDINRATVEELQSVFQLDGTRARYLVETRSRLGSFGSWEQVKSEVPSFEDGMIRNLQSAGARIG